MRTLTAQVLATPGANANAKVQHWMHRDDTTLRFTWRCWPNSPQKALDYPTASVAVRVCRSSRLAADAFRLPAKPGEDYPFVVRRVCRKPQAEQVHRNRSW